jgi:hypothetical protein
MEPGNEPSEPRSKAPTSSEPSRGDAPASELFKVIAALLGPPATAGYAVWRSKATEEQQLLLPFGLLALVLLVFSARQALLHPSSIRWRYSTLGQVAGVVMIFAQLVPSSPAAVQTPSPQTGTDRITKAKLGDTHLRLKRDASGKYTFEVELVNVPSAVEVDVTSTYRGQLWSQRVQAVQCTREGGVVTCALPQLTYTSELFMDLDRPQEVRVYTPSKGCEHFAGVSIDAGARLFAKHRSGELVVKIFEEDVDFTTAGSQVAIVGFYESHMTDRLIRACKKIDCGPIISLSSAWALRELAPFAELPRMFRLTTDNRSRAVDLAALLDGELEADRNSHTIHVIYDDEGVGNGSDEIHYAPDQALELQRVFTERLLARHADLQVRWTSFRYVGGAGNGRLVFREGAPGTAKRRTPASGFEELVRGIRAGTDPIKRVVFVGRDKSIQEFGHAVRSEYASTPEGFADVLTHVPGPREIFEGVSTGCGDHERIAPDLDGFITLSPYGSMETEEGRRFKHLWHGTYPREPVAGRAARVYDALSILAEAISILHAQLRAERHHVDLHAHRRRLEQVLEAKSFAGSSGTYNFEQGEMGGANLESMFRIDVGMVPVPSPEELAVPKPLSQRAADYNTQPRPPL